MSFSLGLGVGLTRRGGVGGAAFDFADYGTPTFVMDANRLNGTDLTTSTNSVGDVVTTWGNTLGAGYPYYNQPTAASRPVLTETKPGIWSVNVGAKDSGPADGVNHMKFWNAGAQVSANLVDTHTFLILYFEGAGVPQSRLLFGIEDVSSNLQIGTDNTGKIRAVGGPSLWGNNLVGTTIMATGAWYLFEADLPEFGTSTIRLNGSVEDTFTPASPATAGQATAINVNVAMMGTAGSAAFINLGGKFQFHATYDITPTADGGTGPLSSGDRAAISDELMTRVNALNAA
jgi:hypothetical protein